jgi:hypothetical protein
MCGQNTNERYSVVISIGEVLAKLICGVLSGQTKIASKSANDYEQSEQVTFSVEHIFETAFK